MDDRERDRTVALLSWLETSGRKPCSACPGPVSNHELVMSHALGYRNAPRCADCLAADLERERVPFLEHVLDYLQHRPCYQAGWEWAGKHAESGPCLRPPHLWGSGGE